MKKPDTIAVNKIRSGNALGRWQISARVNASPNGAKRFHSLIVD
jgi:hypothetical protein